MANIEIKDEDTRRIELELSKMSLKEKTERAVASATLIHNLEYQARHFNMPLTEKQREVINSLNRQLDIIMKEKAVREWFEDEVKMGGTPVIWQPGS